MALKPVRMSLALGFLALMGSADLAQAQRYDPYYRHYNGGAERFVDEYGNIVTVDSYGRVVAVEPPRRSVRQRDRAVILEGRAGEVPPPDVGFGVPGDDYAYGGYDDRRIQGEPLAPPNEYDRTGLSPDGTMTGSIPEDGAYPSPSVPGTAMEGQTQFESHPAPKVAGPKGKNAKIQVAGLQVLLDRAGISPGVIDGRMGSNVDKAVAAYQEMTGRTIDATDSQALVEELDITGGPAVMTYEITNEDVAQQYVASIPEDYSEKAMLPAMAYTRVSEMLAERFHMDEAYLQEINPGADFIRPGTQIKVMNTGSNVSTAVARIIADKGREQVRAYDATGKLVAAYPATIGSTSTPSPSGTVEVARIAFDPNYTYNPKINFKQGQNDKVLTIPPGPNGPVGSMWIALSKPTYGIHGTPEPSKIGKTNSHGCVRLTNWDARELAKLVQPGVTVEFLE